MFSKIRTILKDFSKKKILVIGDIMLDHYISGGSDRISPEAPIPVLSVENEKYVLGGAANVVNNLQAFGCKVYLAGLIGQDEAGQIILKALKEKKVSANSIIKVKDRPTTLKTRIISNDQQMIRLDREDKSELSIDAESKLLKQIKNILTKQNFDAIVLSDYSKGVLNKTTLQSIISLAKLQKTPVIVDPKNHDFKVYKGATYIKPNLKEAEEALKTTINGSDETAIEKAGKKLLKTTGAKGILISRNKYGMTLIEKNTSFHLPVNVAEVSDVSGAGDTVISVFSLGIACGLNAQKAAELSNIAASIVIAKYGTAITSPEELMHKLRTIKEENLTEASDRHDLAQLITLEKKLGNKVVFTNGCFDLLHVGHVKLLENAKKCGDTLVVAINSDSSVKKLKGSGRPLIQEDDRARILLSLSCVDYVVVFSEETPRPLLKILKPDILVKGGDYAHDEVVGWEIVEKYGGKIMTINLVKGKSTTNTLEKILTKNQ